MLIKLFSSFIKCSQGTPKITHFRKEHNLKTKLKYRLPAINRCQRCEVNCKKNRTNNNGRACSVCFQRFFVLFTCSIFIIARKTCFIC